MVLLNFPALLKAKELLQKWMVLLLKESLLKYLQQQLDHSYLLWVLKLLILNLLSKPNNIQHNIILLLNNNNNTILYLQDKDMIKHKMLLGIISNSNSNMLNIMDLLPLLWLMEMDILEIIKELNINKDNLKICNNRYNNKYTLRQHLQLQSQQKHQLLLLARLKHQLLLIYLLKLQKQHWLL